MTLVASYLMPMMYVPAELALKMTVVVAPDWLIDGAGFTGEQLDVNTLLPEATLKKWLSKLPVVIV
ncbi:MAG: hypothetical protein ACJ8CR_26040 [Roseiflexaceae bacterium]